MKEDTAMERRDFLGSTTKAFVAAAVVGPLGSCGRGEEGREAPAKKKIIVGAHPWVYAATQPNYDIYPVLDQIFADMSYAGLDGIELMHTALRPDDALERIRELSKKYALPVIGTSFGGDMWNTAQHEAIFEDARKHLEGRMHEHGHGHGHSHSTGS